MSTSTQWKVIPLDLQILRELAKRQLEIAHAPVNQERRRLWYKHNALQGERPMVLAEAGIVFDEMTPDSSFLCQEKWARDLERQLRATIFQFERIQDVRFHGFTGVVVSLPGTMTPFLFPHGERRTP